MYILRVKDTTRHQYTLFLSEKGDTLNFYSPKMWRLQISVSKKADNAQCLNEKVDRTNFCNEKADITNFYNENRGDYEFW